MRTVGLSQLLQCLQNSLSVYFSIRLTNLYKKKTFSTVHNLDFKNISLLQYGFSEKAVDLFASVLKNRQQCVKIFVVYSENLEKIIEFHRARF